MVQYPKDFSEDDPEFASGYADWYTSFYQHQSRVTIDEDGCTAVAYTVLLTDGAAPPPEDEVDFVADRPFLFVISYEDDLPLFAGVVNQPVE